MEDVDWYLQENFDKVLDIITKIKNAGNHFYKEKNYQKAVKKYKKSCRYIEHLRTSMGSTEDDEEGTYFNTNMYIKVFCLLGSFMYTFYNDVLNNDIDIELPR